MQPTSKKSSNLEKDTADTKQYAKENRPAYISPTIEVELIYMECGIAAASAQIRITGENGGITPDVEDWNVTEHEQQLFL